MRAYYKTRNTGTRNTEHRWNTGTLVVHWNTGETGEYWQNNWNTQ